MEVARDMLALAGRTSDSAFEADTAQFSSIPFVPFRLPDVTECAYRDRHGQVQGAGAAGEHVAADGGSVSRKRERSGPVPRDEVAGGVPRPSGLRNAPASGDGCGIRSGVRAGAAGAAAQQRGVGRGGVLLRGPGREGEGGDRAEPRRPVHGVESEGPRCRQQRAKDQHMARRLHPGFHRQLPRDVAVQVGVRGARGAHDRQEVSIRPVRGLVLDLCILCATMFNLMFVRPVSRGSDGGARVQKPLGLHIQNAYNVDNDHNHISPPA